MLIYQFRPACKYTQTPTHPHHHHHRKNPTRELLNCIMLIEPVILYFVWLRPAQISWMSMYTRMLGWIS